MKTFDALESLRSFRHSLYGCFERRTDALFDLTDAILTAGVVPSPVHLSLQPSHRRGWGSLYSALNRGRVDEEALRELVARYPLPENRAAVYGVDISVWPRCDAEASPQRGYYYHPSRHSAGQPIVAGWAYQWIAQLGFERDGWMAPMDLERVHPSDNANEVATEQVKQLLRRLPERKDAPLFVFDAGYDPVRLQQRLEGCRAQMLVRLRSGRCFYADPPPPAWTGRPRRHGPKLDTKDPTTWPAPSEELHCEDPAYGTVEVRAWANLHPKVQFHGDRGTRGPRPSCGVRWFWLKFHAFRGQLARRARCGCGGMAWESRTSTSSGEPTLGVSIWSTPSASSNRRLGGPPHGYATQNRPTAGVG
jgi:DDE superfamily endonuclease